MKNIEKYETKRFSVEKITDTETGGVAINIFVGVMDFFMKDMMDEANKMKVDTKGGNLIKMAVNHVIACINKIQYDRKPIVINNLSKHLTSWSDFEYTNIEEVCGNISFSLSLKVYRDSHSLRDGFIIKLIEEYNKGIK